jgi:hypothetical protein
MKANMSQEYMGSIVTIVSIIGVGGLEENEQGMVRFLDSENFYHT